MKSHKEIFIERHDYLREKFEQAMGGAPTESDDDVLAMMAWDGATDIYASQVDDIWDRMKEREL